MRPSSANSVIRPENPHRKIVQYNLFNNRKPY